jgi:general secretion pathway protein D
MEVGHEVSMAVARALKCSILAATVLVLPTVSSAQNKSSATDTSIVSRNDSVSIHLVDVDIRTAIEALGPFLEKPVTFGIATSARISLQTPTPIPRSDVGQLLRGLLASQGFDLRSDTGLYTVQARPVATPPSTNSTVATAASGIQLFAVHLRHARAADVAATVNALYGRASAVGELGSRPSTLDEQLRQNQIPPGEVASPLAVPGVVGKLASFAGDVTIVPDPRSNSLLIRAGRTDFDLVQAAVAELDVRPLQVLIEVLIVEARRDRSFSFGVDATSGPTGIRGTDATVSSSQSSAGTLGDFVLRVMNVGGINLKATLSAAESRGDVKILSRPVVLAANNEQAQILVGSQRPFVQVARSLPTDAATRDEVVQYKDVGTRLVVKPTISADGYLTLEVSQEVNSATAEVAFNAPVISTRSVQTKLLIKDGQTVALGGLTDRQRDTNKGGIPLLSRIPLIGGLFGHESRQMNETELFLFLTPHVMRTDAEADSVTRPMLERAEKSKP